MATRLFSKTKRTDMGSRNYSESHFAYLQRSGRRESGRVRALLNRWFAAYPDNDKVELRGRFCTDVETSFMSAFFELYIHNLLLQLGYSVEVHPPSPSATERRPDFLATSAGKDDCYVEAVLATDYSQEDIGAKQRENVVYDTLNKLDSPNFWLVMEIGGSPATPVPGSKLRKALSKWLACLDPDVLTKSMERSGLDALPTYDFSHDGWDIVFRPLPKPPRLRGQQGVRPVGIRMYDPEWGDSRSAVHDAITRKAARYGELDKPYIIAVNVLAEKADRDTVPEVLYGTKTLDLTRPFASESGGVTVRNCDGVWITPVGPRNARVSAVLATLRLHPWSIASSDLSLYHNPCPALPYSGALCCLAQGIPRAEEIGGVHPREILNLRAKWPE